MIFLESFCIQNNLTKIKIIKKLKLMKKFIFIIFCLLFLIYCILIEPNRLEITNYSIQDQSLSGIKVVLIGDLHLRKNQEKRLIKIVDKINEQNADLILSVGDFVKGHKLKSTLPIEIIAKHLGNLNAKNGVYTVLGNHDWWIDGEKMTTEFKKNKIKILANSNIKLNINGKILYIAGIEDLVTREPNIYKSLQGTSSPIILLTHHPDMFPDVPETVNLTFAGHVHGGQVRFPFIGAPIVPSMFGDKYSRGLIIENNKKMIITSGIGTSILPIRFNCSPEIVVIEFY